jgi:hypothetical protein
MKTFIIKIFYFISILFLIIVSVAFYFYKKSDLVFVSHSISYNLKQEFIIKYKKEIIKCNYFVIGSSMSLNNIDCILLSKKLSSQVFNLSSWGTKFSDFANFNIWNKKNIIITNINFSDFGNSEIKVYPLNSSRFVNIAKDLGIFISQINDKENYMKSQINDHYTSLNFDKSGSLIFSEKNFFKIDAGKWNLKEKKLSEIDINNFINEIRAKATSTKRIIITFSPIRKHLYNFEQSASLKKLGKYLNLIPNVNFINNYDRTEFTDEDFVDFSHFNKQGAQKYTELISGQIDSILENKVKGIVKVHLQ